MGLYGAKEIEVGQFAGGLVTDVDATELQQNQTPDCQNVDLRDETVSTRRGRVAFNNSAPVASPVRALHAWYAPGGSRKLLLQAGTALYEDNGAGGFTSKVSGLTGGAPGDFCQYKLDTLWGNGVDPVYKRDSGGTWGLSALLTAPAAGPVATIRTSVVESFDFNGTHATDPTQGWVLGGTNNFALGSGAADDIGQVEGTNSLRVRMTATNQKNAYAMKSWSAAAAAQTTLNGTINNSTTTVVVTSAAGMGAGDYLQVEAEVMLITAIATNTLTVTRAQGGTTAASHLSGVNATVSKLDLSEYGFLVVWYLCDKAGVAFKIGIRDNTGLLDFSKFPPFTTQSPGTWVPVEVPLTGIPAASRTASLGLGVQYLSKPSSFSFGTINLYFDQAVPEVGFDADTYEYSATWATVSQQSNLDVPSAESNPSPLVSVEVKALPVVSGVSLAPLTGGAPTGANAMRFYRHRPHGTLRLPRLIGSGPAGTTTLSGAIDSAATQLVLSDPTGYVPVASGSVGSLLTIGTEQLLITAVDTTGASVKFTVSRGYGGTTPAAHANGATVTFAGFLDQIPDGTIILLDTPEQTAGKIPPPLAGCYAVANGRLLAGNVNLGGTQYPYRLYLSRAFYPEEFSSQENPGDSSAAEAGWIDIPTKDTILRMVEFDGMTLIFCDRSVWALEGSGWDDFDLRKRSDVGLVAREAVCVAERQVYYYAEDGVRILSPNRAFDGLFSSWIVSEPINTKLKAIPAAYRKNAAMGVDELGRVHLSYTGPGQTVNDRALVFDPNLKDSIEFSAFAGGVVPEHYYNMKRPGWHYYTNWGFSLFKRLKKGSAGDAGQLLGGDVSTAVVHYLQQDGSGNDLFTDAGSAISWYWRTKDQDAGPGHRAALVFVKPLFSAAAAGNTTLSAGIDAATTTVPVSSASGYAIGDYLQIDSEVLLITNIVSNTLTATRAQAGSAAATHANGATVTKVYCVTVTPMLNGAAGANVKTLCLGTGTSGMVEPAARFGAADYGRRIGLKIAGSQAAQLLMQSLAYGATVRQ